MFLGIWVERDKSIGVPAISCPFRRRVENVLSVVSTTVFQNVFKSLIVLELLFGPILAPNHFKKTFIECDGGKNILSTSESVAYGTYTSWCVCIYKDLEGFRMIISQKPSGWVMPDD